MADCKVCKGEGRILCGASEHGCSGKTSFQYKICSKCKGTGKEPGCLVSTAVCKALGKADDCDELMILRNFRDQYLLRTHEGRKLVEEYYNISPALVDELTSQSRVDPLIFERIYAYHLVPVVRAISKGQHEIAISEYKIMLAAVRQSPFEA
jgi:hypothetical protein